MNRLKNKVYSLEIICYYTGYIVLCISAVMIIPLITALLFQEWDPFFDFAISMALAILVGLILIMIGMQSKENKSNVQWKHGFTVAALSWILLTILCAVPYYLSGHILSFTDACFDVMSGFTTTGLVLTQDLDHLSNALNMWRHILTFLGGQGMVVLTLTFLVKETGGAYKMYVGEGKDIELVPNVKGTARQIWKISMVYLAIGTLALWIVGLIIGLKPVSAFLHALYIFESSWSTGGFAPMTQNIMYYHSGAYETVAMVIFILGSFNFGLHYALWQGKRKEIVKNIETQSFFVTSFLACIFALAGLAKLHVYPDIMSGYRRVVFNVLSAHTTTGFGSVYARQFALEWGDFGVLIMVIVMMIGGSACSTAGGFKGLRVGIVFKGLIMDVRKLLSSERSLKVFKYHHIKDYILEDGVVRSSAIIICCYMVMFTVGTLLGAYLGYPLSSAAFESASVSGNVGLSIGVTTPSMPLILKLYYIVAMYLGRLEFLSVFALIGYAIGGIKKICLTTVNR
ncbi:potassium transporter TrkG [Anaerocolumna sp. AGMB13025]|uniref:TrkH family potassium uptake protein n=1 Tax=Anaerocolumna sp. AGMB13025 TaxID=3039116 RepID=UPI00241DA5E2|nr:potassium transporter TrkG [Anaerocolumna sp. AGMB13025]WFR60058.1 potassium transporter TrkG [Anaerocolumna sp. AGMB13025]